MSHPKGYVAGPMRGLPYFNFPAFFAAAEVLEHTFGIPIANPAQMDIAAGCDPNDELAMPPDLRDIFTRDLTEVADTDVLFLLEGWDMSSGAFLEGMLGCELDLQFFEVFNVGPTGLDLVPITKREVYVRTWFLHLTRCLPEMWIVRQCGHLRRWVRKVLLGRLRVLQARWRGTLVHIPRIPDVTEGPDPRPDVRATPCPLFDPGVV